MCKKISLSVRGGYLKKSIIDLLNVKLNPGEIKLLPGGIKHIRKKDQIALINISMKFQTS